MPESHEKTELRAPIRLVAVGDSFTEGVGDELPDGTSRGWADLVAQGIADATGEPVQYANLAIRGQLLTAIIEEQVDAALALEPTMITFNGGGNDMLRPRVSPEAIIQQTEGAIRRILDAGVRPVLLAGANPTVGIPQGDTVRARGDELTRRVTQLAERLGITLCDNWNDSVLARREYWSEDRLHLSTTGHHRVASNVLRALGYDAPSDWVLDAPHRATPTRAEQLRYTREHVLPWIGRRLTGRSSGDGRRAKFPEFVTVAPRANRETES